MHSRLRMLRRCGLTLAAAAFLSCHGEDVPTSSTTFAITGDEEPASEDGVITDPVPPEGFTGDPNATLPITPAEEAALADALALSLARNASNQAPVDRGFATTLPAVVSVEASEESP